MPTALYIRGEPGTGKRTVCDVLERDLKWPVVWVHAFDAVYKAIGEYQVPGLTDKLIRATAAHVMHRGKDLIVVRPSRQTWGMDGVRDEAKQFGHKFIAVRLTANYKTLCTRVTRRWHASEFRITTAEALDKYLLGRKAEDFAGEHVIETDDLTPEQVAGKIKELLP